MGKKLFSAYTEVFVVFRQGDYDISEIFTDKTLAESECIKSNEKMKTAYGWMLSNNYKVIPLDEAIESIKEEVKLDAQRDRDEEM